MAELDDDTFVKALYPNFREWIKSAKRYQCADGINLIMLWYEYLRSLKI